MARQENKERQSISTSAALDKRHALPPNARRLVFHGDVGRLIKNLRQPSPREPFASELKASASFCRHLKNIDLELTAADWRARFPDRNRDPMLRSFNKPTSFGSRHGLLGPRTQKKWLNHRETIRTNLRDEVLAIAGVIAHALCNRSLRQDLRPRRQQWQRRVPITRPMPAA